MAIVENSFSVSRMDGDLSPGTVSSREDDESPASLASSSGVGSEDCASDADSGMGFDEIDISEFGEPGMEFCQVGNQSCSIPLELYDLTDLGGVLSLETWNDCLTEKERFTLAQYLPDTEQEGFALNLKELFSGRNFFFGNPAMHFFNILRAGQCDPRVVLYRHALNLFQQHRHYHILKMYQNSMVKTILRMRNTWMSCDGYTIEQKARVLNILRSQRDVCFSRNGDLGSEPDSETGDSIEVYSGNRSQKDPFVVFSQGSSMTMEPVRFGKKKAKGILKVAAPKVCKNNKGSFPLPFDPGTYKKAEMPKQKKDYYSGFDLLNGGGRVSVEELGNKLGGQCVFNAGNRTTMARTGLTKSKDKKDLSKMYGRYMQNDFNEEGRERYPDHHGRGRTSNQEVKVASFDYNLVKNVKKPKHSHNNFKYCANDGVQHSLPKTSQGSAATQLLRHKKDDDESVPLNNLALFDTRNIRGKKLKAGDHYRSDINRSGFDSKAKSYKVPPEEDRNPVFFPKNRKQISQGKLRDKSSYRKGVSKEYLRGSSIYPLSDETESYSSDQVRDGRDKYPHASKSKFPSTATEAQNSGIVKLAHDSRKKSKAAKSNKIDCTHSLGGCISGHTPEDEPRSKSVKQKSKTSYGINLQEVKSVSKGQAVNLFEKLQPAIISSYTADRKRKYSADLLPSSQHANETCNFGNGILDEAEDSFDADTSLPVVQRQAKIPEDKNQRPSNCMLVIDHYQSSDIPLTNNIAKGEDDCHKDLDEHSQFRPKRQSESIPNLKKKGKRKADALTVSSHMLIPDPIVSENAASELDPVTNMQKKSFNLITPTIHTGFSFSIIHLLSAVRKALVSSRMEDNPEIGNHLKEDVMQSKQGDSKCLNQVSNGSLLSHSQDHMECIIIEPDEEINLPSFTIQEIVNCVRSNPGDPCILETQEPLQDLVRGALRIFTSRTAPLGAKGWKALVSYKKSSKSWAWVGPLSISSSDYDNAEETSAETWSIPHKMLVKLVDAFANWLKSGQETLQQIGSLPAPPEMLPILDEKERFRDLRAQKSLSTIMASSEEVRAYFRKEELLRYSIPDRAFQYTAVDGRKSIVAPLRRGGGKPTSKARDHFMLKPDRPPHVTVLCLVRDSAARLPGNVGTRADVCTLIRDSQYIVEEVTDAQINQVVSGALDRLHYERDPCVQFDGDRKLWVYLHRDREDEDFEDDGTSSTKKWKRQRKDATDNSDMAANNDSNHFVSGSLALVASSGCDFHSDINVDSSALNIEDNDELVYSDLRPTKENIQSYINTAHSLRRPDIPISWEALGLNHLQENKMVCQENSINEYFDDQSFSRDRPAGFLSGSLL